MTSPAILIAGGTILTYLVAIRYWSAFLKYFGASHQWFDLSLARLLASTYQGIIAAALLYGVYLLMEQVAGVFNRGLYVAIGLWVTVFGGMFALLAYVTFPGPTWVGHSLQAAAFCILPLFSVAFTRRSLKPVRSLVDGIMQALEPFRKLPDDAESKYIAAKALGAVVKSIDKAVDHPDRFKKLLGPAMPWIAKEPSYFENHPDEALRFARVQPKKAAIAHVLWRVSRATLSIQSKVFNGLFGAWLLLGVFVPAMAEVDAVVSSKATPHWDTEIGEIRAIIATDGKATLYLERSKSRCAIRFEQPGHATLWRACKAEQLFNKDSTDDVTTPPAPDAGVPTDSAGPTDSTVPTDSAVPTDLAVPADLVLRTDAAVPRDAGLPVSSQAVRGARLPDE